MKYAILDSGGKQYIAREGETIEVDRLPLEIGKPVEFNDVLLIADNGKISIGNPMVKGAKVKGRVVDQIKAAKIIVFKYVPKQRYRRKQGHRQRYTRVEIESIAAAATRKKTTTKAEEESGSKTTAKKTTAKPKAETKKTTTKKSTTAKSSTAKSTTTKKPAASKTSAPKKSASTTKKAAPKKSTTRKSSSSSSKKSSTADKKDGA
jgi:large subunit ribosomal protein L21